MIITRIEATNVLKYKQLSMALPEEGLIAISGQNESGKSSIGEAVCFALFGRTFSIGPDDLHKVVRWGENHCSVTLEFKVGAQAYVLSSFLDRDGNYSAKLMRAGKEEPVARGIGQVDEALSELLGFEYEQFVESFYLAQREITTPHPHSQAVKIMAGIAPLERVADEIRDEIGEREDLLEEVQAECDALREELDELDFQPGYLKQLQDERFETQDQVDRISGLSQEIAARLQTYTDNTREGYKVQSARGRAAFFRFVFFVLAALAGATWWLRGPGAGSFTLPDELNGLLERYLQLLQQVPQQWLSWAAIGSGVLFLLMWMRVAGRRARLRAEAGELADSLLQARALDIEIEQETAELVLAQSDAEDDEAEVEPAPVRPDAVELEGLAERIASGEAVVRQVREYVEPELKWLGYVQQMLGEQLELLDAAIAEEEERVGEHRNLLDIQAGIREKRDDVLARIYLRNKALELLNGAISHLSNNFNRDIKDLVARMLPRFTDGRYEHLQIDQDLKVRIFSSEKRDFMGLEEVSSGTQRQIMLALRLALSQKLLSRKIKGGSLPSSTRSGPAMRWLRWPIWAPISARSGSLPRPSRRMRRSVSMPVSRVSAAWTN